MNWTNGRPWDNKTFNCCYTQTGEIRPWNKSDAWLQIIVITFLFFLLFIRFCFVSFFFFTQSDGSLNVEIGTRTASIKCTHNKPGRWNQTKLWTKKKTKKKRIIDRYSISSLFFCNVKKNFHFSIFLFFVFCFFLVQSFFNESRPTPFSICFLLVHTFKPNFEWISDSKWPSPHRTTNGVNRKGERA